jgi:hypothetical protein
MFTVGTTCLKAITATKKELDILLLPIEKSNIKLLDYIHESNNVYAI